MSAAANSATESAPARNWAHYTDPEWIDVDGLATAYRREGSGEPLLFLNGERGTRSWLPVCEELAKSFDVILPEHPGFGDTEMPEWLSGFDDLVLHYDALLRALGLEKVHLVGHSVGAWIAADLGVFYPERFASLSLVTPTGVRLPDEVRVADVFRLGEDAPDVLFNGRGEEFAEFFEQEGGIDDKVQAYSELVTLARLAWNPRYDWRLDRRLARIEAPTLVIAAEEDRLYPREMAARFAELIPDAALITLEGGGSTPSGHMLHIEHPAATAELIGGHIGSA